MSSDCPTPSASLRGRTVALHPWQVEDAEWYVAARDDEILRWTNEPPELAAEAVRAAIRGNREQPRWVGLAVADASTGALLGNIALRPTGAASGEGEISYRLAPGGRGRGAATEAVGLLVDWAFRFGGFRRIVLHTRPGNERSQAVARRAGFAIDSADASRHRFVLDNPGTAGRVRMSQPTG